MVAVNITPQTGAFERREVSEYHLVIHSTQGSRNLVYWDRTSWAERATGRFLWNVDEYGEPNVFVAGDRLLIKPQTANLLHIWADGFRLGKGYVTVWESDLVKAQARNEREGRNERENRARARNLQILHWMRGLIG